MDVDKEMRRFICFRYLHPVFVKLQTSVLATRQLGSLLLVRM